MHELSIAGSVLEIVCRHAAGRRVTRIVLSIGHLRQVVPDALTFSFALVAMGTEAEGAELVLETVPAIGACRRCGAQSAQRAFPLCCAACGAFDIEVVAGEDLIVESLELEEEPVGAHC